MAIEIKAADVMKLRKMTGAGMMDCKKALVESEGDFDRAKEIIKEKGKLVAAKRADRETSEGAVIAKIGDGKAIVVGLGCETDFVAKNADFQALAQAIAEAAIVNFPADKVALMACKLADGRTVEAAITELTGQTGEKHVIAGYEAIEAAHFSAYMHVITGKLAAIVGFSKELDAEVAKGVAMQVASMNPVAVSAENVEQSVLDAEYKTAIEKTKDELVQKEINSALTKAGINPAHVDSEDHIESNQSKGWITAEQAAQAREIIKTVGEAKAANLNMQMIENIAKGRVQKFLKENTLLEQGYQMGDGKTPVKDVIKAADPEVKVVAFKRISLAD